MNLQLLLLLLLILHVFHCYAPTFYIYLVREISSRCSSTLCSQPDSVCLLLSAPPLHPPQLPAFCSWCCHNIVIIFLFLCEMHCFQFCGFSVFLSASHHFLCAMSIPQSLAIVSYGVSAFCCLQMHLPCFVSWVIFPSVPLSPLSLASLLAISVSRSEFHTIEPRLLCCISIPCLAYPCLSHQLCNSWFICSIFSELLYGMLACGVGLLKSLLMIVKLLSGIWVALLSTLSSSDLTSCYGSQIVLFKIHVQEH